MPAHVHLLLALPPKHSGAHIVGGLKGKSSIWLAQNGAKKPRNFVGHKFWASGSFVSTVGAEEQGIKTDSPNQAREDPRIDDLFNR